MNDRQKARKLQQYQFLLIIVNIVIILIGLFFIFESSSVESFQITSKQLAKMSADEVQGQSPHVWKLVQKQVTGVGVGIALFVAGFFFPKKYWLKLAPVFYGLSIILLIMPFIPFFSNGLQGANRWIRIFNFSFQPIELVKFMLITFFAWLFARKTDPITMITYLLPPAILIILQPDFASLVLLVSTIVIMYFLAGAKWKNIFILGGLAILALTLVMIIEPYRMDRIKTFLEEKSTQNLQTNNEAVIISAEEWHSTQLKYALGRGGWFGVGVGKSMQKYGYLPETSSDSIFAVVGEELGFVGVIFIIGLYVLYFWLIKEVIYQSDVDFSLKLLASGLGISLLLQTLIHFAAISGLAPLTGITLPFFSYGSSSLTMSMFITGVILGITQMSIPVKKGLEY